MAEQWRNVWHVPGKDHGWRKRLEPAGEDKFFGTEIHASQQAAMARAKTDEYHFCEELGMNVSYLGPRQIA